MLPFEICEALHVKNLRPQKTFALVNNTNLKQMIKPRWLLLAQEKLTLSKFFMWVWVCAREWESRHDRASVRVLFFSAHSEFKSELLLQTPSSLWLYYFCFVCLIKIAVGLALFVWEDCVVRWWHFVVLSPGQRFSVSYQLRPQAKMSFGGTWWCWQYKVGGMKLQMTGSFVVKQWFHAKCRIRYRCLQAVMSRFLCK